MMAVYLKSSICWRSFDKPGHMVLAFCETRHILKSISYTNNFFSNANVSYKLNLTIWDLIIIQEKKYLKFLPAYDNGFL